MVCMYVCGCGVGIDELTGERILLIGEERRGFDKTKKNKWNRLRIRKSDETNNKQVGRAKIHTAFGSAWLWLLWFLSMLVFGVLRLAVPTPLKQYTIEMCMSFVDYVDCDNWLARRAQWRSRHAELLLKNRMVISPSSWLSLYFSLEPHNATSVVCNSKLPQPTAIQSNDWHRGPYPDDYIGMLQCDTRSSHSQCRRWRWWDQSKWNTLDNGMEYEGTSPIIQSVWLISHWWRFDRYAYSIAAMIWDKFPVIQLLQPSQLHKTESLQVDPAHQSIDIRVRLVCSISTRR